MKNLTVLLLLISVMTPAVGAQRRRGTVAQRRGRANRTASVARPKPPACPPSAAVTTPSGLTLVITRRGGEQRLKVGDKVSVHYTGLLTDGTKFDSSLERSAPITFELGAGRVIKGWDEGITGLHVGDRATLIIPPLLGYGAKGAGGVIPPDATLIFVVDVVGVEEASPPTKATPPSGDQRKF